MRSDKQNTSVHAVATSIVFDRVKGDDLSNEIPNVDLKNVDFMDLLKLDEEEVRCTRERQRRLDKQLASCHVSSRPTRSLHFLIVLSNKFDQENLHSTQNK